MRRTLGLVLVLSLTGLTRAADEPRHNKLTPQEAADGWILLFDGETTFGWTSPNGSQWTIVNGMLAPQSDKHGLLVTTTAFADFDLMIQYRARNDSKMAVFVGCDASGKGADKILSQKGGVKTEGKTETLPAENPPTQVNLVSYGSQWMEAQIQIRNGQVNGNNYYPADSNRRFVRIAREPFPPKGDVEPPPRVGHIALSGNAVIFRDIRIKPVGGKSLFNGKDLTGWKKFEGDPKRAKSTFAVSREGYLTIKDGPGDLQTTDQWANFLLQIDCKTNGPKLNSGVFFRCIPGEYQNGYEAQIHNGWLEKPKEVVVEDHDPKTHELKDKRKVQTLAMDYGTGAIYRRVPARKEVAKDNEWFKMTVVANGNHIATWVNGVQVVDWTDNRPANDNPRNGCKVGKGAISLQGHDPTTDLAFHNIVLVDLSPPK
jgi:hypothetical protein